MRRGDLVTVLLQGEPRPAVAVQSDLFSELSAVTVLPITSTLIDAPLLRVTVEPSSQNGLNKPSQIMIDKPQTPPRGKLGGVIGHLDDATLLTVNRALAIFFAWRDRDRLRTIDIQPRGCLGKRDEVTSAEAKLPAAVRSELRN
ncbi:MAG: type II toxin-antitoxin system PemK/MazF family toxin [Janthinobacterium lividum]